MSATTKTPEILPITPENYPERVPEFSSEEEARDFWDTHDSSFYWDQMETVADFRDEDPVPLEDRPPSTASRRRPTEKMELLSLRFPSEMIETVRQIADRKHLPYQTMIKSWVGERVEQEQRAAARNDDQ